MTYDEFSPHLHFTPNVRDPSIFSYYFHTWYFRYFHWNYYSDGRAYNRILIFHLNFQYSDDFDLNHKMVKMSFVLESKEKKMSFAQI